MDGVTIEKKTKSNRKSTTEVILADKELMASIERGEKDLVEGKSKRMTAAVINNLLGL